MFRHRLPDHPRRVVVWLINGSKNNKIQASCARAINIIVRNGGAPLIQPLLGKSNERDLPKEPGAIKDFLKGRRVQKYSGLPGVSILRRAEAVH